MQSEQERIGRLREGEKVVVLPDGYLHFYKRRRGSRELLVSVPDLLAYLYKAVGDPQQHPMAADAYRFLAERLEGEAERYG